MSDRYRQAPPAIAKHQYVENPIVYKRSLGGLRYLSISFFTNSLLIYYIARPMDDVDLHSMYQYDKRKF